MTKERVNKRAQTTDVMKIAKELSRARSGSTKVTGKILRQACICGTGRQNVSAIEDDTKSCYKAQADKLCRESGFTTFN